MRWRSPHGARSPHPSSGGHPLRSPSRLPEQPLSGPAREVSTSRRQARWSWWWWSWWWWSTVSLAATARCSCPIACRPTRPDARRASCRGDLEAELIRPAASATGVPSRTGSENSVTSTASPGRSRSRRWSPLARLCARRGRDRCGAFGRCPAPVPPPGVAAERRRERENTLCCRTSDLVTSLCRYAASRSRRRARRGRRRLHRCPMPRDRLPAFSSVSCSERIHTPALLAAEGRLAALTSAPSPTRPGGVRVRRGGRPVPAKAPVAGVLACRQTTPRPGSQRMWRTRCTPLGTRGPGLPSPWHPCRLHRRSCTGHRCRRRAGSRPRDTAARAGR